MTRPLINMSGILTPTLMTPTDFRLRALKNGYNVTPLINGKAAFLPGWQSLVATPAMVMEWERDHPHARSTGLVCGKVVALDLDLLQDGAADELEAELSGWYRNAKILVRYGLAPKRAVLFRARAPFQKFARLLTAPANSGLAACSGKTKGGPRIELIGAGAQIVADGIHPDTLRPYYWVGGSPCDVHVDELPAI